MADSSWKLLSVSKQKLLDLLYEAYYKDSSSDFFLSNKIDFDKNLGLILKKNGISFRILPNHRSIKRRVEGVSADSVDMSRDGIAFYLKSIYDKYANHNSYIKYVKTLRQQVLTRGKDVVSLHRNDKPKDVEYFSNLRNRLPLEPVVFFRAIRPI